MLVLNLASREEQRFRIGNNICIKMKLSEKIKNKRKLLLDSNVIIEFLKI